MATVNVKASGVSRTTGKMKSSRVVAPRNPKLVTDEIGEERQTPSAYMAEMALTTDERLKQTHEMRLPQVIELLDMSETTHQKFTTVDIEVPLFQPFPSDIVFQNYEPFETYTVPLHLRNNDKVARLVKVTQADSPYFEIISPPDVGHKVAPGMDTIFLIKFTPDEKKDYSHELICITEREKFLVPIKAVGARAILDFPDDISFQPCPVKYNSTKTLLIRNVGNRGAKFELETESPFSATPDSCVLGVAESIQIDIAFHPMKTGDYESDMVIAYDTGESLYVTLYGVSIDVNVRLDKNTVKLENTFISSASQRMISIMNRSDVIVHFEWKPLATLAEELQQKQRFYQELSYKEEERKDNFIEECITDPSIRDKLSLVTRSFKNRIRVAEGEKMLYSDDIIAIDPVEGDIWPNSHADINIAFKPDEAKSYARTIYCDVTGRESRLPLRIRGEGIGSKVKFSFDTLDIEKTFVNSEHSYEVIMKNTGDIDAVFYYVQSQSLFGQQFDFTPAEGIIKPGGYQAIQIHFTSPYLGSFNEEFRWKVDGSPETFRFNVRGSVVGPTFHFDTPKLKFNTVSYGFTHVAACTLINTSLIPMTFYLRIPSDGAGPSAAAISASFLDDRYVEELHPHELPKEFEIYPNTGTLNAQSAIEIQVNLTSITEQKYETCMVVDVEGVGQEILSLPISASCIVPGIGLETPILDYGRCFIRYPYENMVVLKNETDLPAKYELLPQIPDGKPTIRYQTNYAKGIIQPQSIIEIPLQITVHGMGRQVTSALFMIYGCSEMPLQVQLVCTGEGPVVHASTLDIDFGAILVLEDVRREIKLSNESLIPAEFYCDMVRPHSLFSVEPTHGIIPAERAMTVVVTATVDDCLRFQDKLKISVTDGQLHTVLLSAQGTGTTIVSEPPMAPIIDIGAIFTSRPCTMKFRLFNRGRRSQQIFWSTEGFPLVRSKKKKDYNLEDVKYQRMPPPADPPRPVFKLRPDRMSLSPGQSQEVVLEGFSDKCKQVKERMICHAIVGSNTGKEKIMKVDVVAEFIDPLVRFSARNVNFCVMKHPHTELMKETKELLLGNISKLPLKVLLDTQYPFQLMQEGDPSERSNMSLCLRVNESVPILVQFDPDYQKDRFCRTALAYVDVAYQDHPNTDCIELRGDVYYPNLDFETNVVDFGCVLNDTEHIRNVTVTNQSPLKVKFKWNFEENAINFDGKEDDEGLGKDMSDGEEFIEAKDKSRDSLDLRRSQTSSTNDRPRTSPAISHVPLQMRPTTAPESAPLTDQRYPLLPWMPQAPINESIGIQEVFDVLPLYGELVPGETQQFQFTFYGHSHAMAEAVAVCSVYGGPDYRIHLKGQASLVQYGFNCTNIDLGRQIYDQPVSSEVILFNRGKVNFDFTVLDSDRGSNPMPGGVAVHPAQGIVEAQQSQALLIRYMPGFPDTFQKQLQVRVGHFEPDVITLTGRGIFPRISFDLPRDNEDPRYCKYLESARSNEELKIEGKSSAVSPNDLELTAIPDMELQEEVDRLQVKDFAAEAINQDQTFVQSTFLNTTSTKGSKKSKQRARLSDYVLDFGFVNFGMVKTKTCLLTNPSCLPVSYVADRHALTSTGFSIDIDKVKNLPQGETVQLNVSVDPKSGNLSLGPVDTILPIKILNGPSIGLRLKGVITMPDIQLSSEMIDFDSVVCGQCKVITVQMYNYCQVKCQWTAEIYKEKQKKSSRTRTTVRKAMKAQKDARTFEMMPPTGMLYPGQRVNVQVKFMPTDEDVYGQKLVISLMHSVNTHVLTCKGRGVEPKIEFEKLMVNFGPVLPHSSGDEAEVAVKNPCNFPLEFYCLEFDKKYLEEEKILRSMKGYDEYNTILLPPRPAGVDLPKELIEAYNEMRRKKDGDTKITVNPALDEKEPSDRKESQASAIEQVMNIASKVDIEDGESDVEMESEKGESEYGVGELEITPISAAIARHLGIDLSAEGKAARNRRGIAIIVHGAPLSGKSATAAALADKFHIASLSVDDIIKEAISSGVSSASVRIRELSTIAARNVAAALEAEAVQQGVSNVTVNTALAAQPGGAPSTTAGALHTGFRESRKTATQPAMKQHKTAHLSPPSTPPLPPPQPRKLSIVYGPAETAEFYSCILPDDLLVEIIAEKLQSSECQMGVVFDGLDSMFAANMTSCANALLRAINNRKYIFAVTLKLTKERLKSIEEKKREKAMKKEKEEQEAERIRLDEMSEDEYEALPEEEKAEIDRKRLHAKKRKIKQRENEEQREREIREEKLAEEKRLEEENKSKLKQKRAAASQGTNRKGHEKDVKEKKHEKSSDRLTVTREATAPKDKQSERANTSGNLSDRSESTEDPDKRKNLSANRTGKRDRASSLGATQTEEVTKPTEEETREKELNLRFQAFDHSIRDINTLFEAWDRTTGSVFISESEKSDMEQDAVPVPVGKKGLASHKKMEKEKEKEREKEREREKEKSKEVAMSPISAVSVEHVDHLTDDEEASKLKGRIGIPNIQVQTINPQQSMLDAVLLEHVLPAYDDVQEGLGLGPSGPPIPPSASFCVIPYPRRRKPNLVNEFGAHYVFISNSADDPNAMREEILPKTPEPEVEKTEKRDHRSRRGRDKEETVTTRASKTDSRLPSGGRRGLKSFFASGIQTAASPPMVSPSGADDDKSTIDSTVNISATELIRYRWVVPSQGQIKLRIRFTSQEVGRYDQTLNFEIVGTRRRYQLFCRGVCCFPAISREPRIVFPHRKKYRKPGEVVHGKYILSSKTYEFGPLLAGKNRDRYREGRYPENMEQLCISNTSPMEAEISFCFQTDTNASTFLIEPVFMTLKPNDSQMLNIWAYPKTPGSYEDIVVGCIKENPEPILFKVSCNGVRPELELDKKLIQFDRVLLYRTETRTVYLRNSTLLPVAWKLSGMDNLGDDFSVPADTGVIEPMTEFALQMDFKAIKATNVKKVVRLEVSDAANIIGLTHAENIQVQAEAYDVALDMSFPKGADGGLDFSTLRVFDEAKQSLSVKNKGRYEIGYNFVFESTETCPNAADLFTVTPNNGTLIPSDRPTQVQVTFKSNDETTIKEEPILRCQIIEPSLGEAGEVIAGIPVKISVRSVFSKYSIFPVQDINFGAILVNTRKTKTITIENKGEFDFRYSIAKQQNDVPVGKFKSMVTSKRSRDGSASNRSHQMVPQQLGTSKQKRTDSVRGEISGTTTANVPAGGTSGASTVKLQLGMFTIFPASGVILPGGSSQITVDMLSETSAASEEDLSIDISERPPQDCQGGIEYKVIGEACLPSICTLQQNVSSIFEEHRIVSNLNIFRYHAQELEPGSGVFGEEENKFVFYNVIVGHKVKARIKISNPNKVVCDVLFSVKPISNKPALRWTDVYSVEPQRAAVQPHSFAYVTITFQPPSMQSYSAIFEAAVDGLPNAIARGRNLLFDIQGDGNLPRITFLRPTTMTKKGGPLLLFSRLLTNRTQTLPLIMKNQGSLPCRVNMTLSDPECCFTVNKKVIKMENESESSEHCIETVLECTSSKPVIASFNFKVGAAMEFLVDFTPSEKKRISAEIRVSVVDNPFEDATIQLLGEGFEEEITVDNIHGGMQDSPVTFAEDDDFIVPRNNHINFGDCALCVANQQSFTLTNHSENDIIRFTWDPPPQFTFSPCTGHLLPNCAKDIKVTFESEKPTKLEAVQIPCKISKIQLAQNAAKAGGWDDRMRTVKWIDVKPEILQTKTEDAEKQTVPAPEIQSTPRPTKRKVVETEVEPAYTAITGANSEVELLFSAIADYAKYELNTNKVFFKDTLMFQTIMYSFVLKNTGAVKFEYNWILEPGWTREPTEVQQERSDDRPSAAPSTTPSANTRSTKGSRERTKSPKTTAVAQKAAETRPVTRTATSSVDQNRATTTAKEIRPVSRLASAVDGRPASAMALAYDAGSVYSEPVGSDLWPFTIEPSSGHIMPQEEATFTVRFSPLEIHTYGATLIANIPNLEPGIEAPVLLLQGRSSLPWCHFELEESNYMTSRRNPELKGPGGAPPGCTLDPNTKVIEFVSCGIKTKTTRRFFIMNPTNKTYSFSWTNEDATDPSRQLTYDEFTCLTPKGSIEAGKKVEIIFEYTPDSMDLRESFWRFYIQEQNVSVSFLLVGITTDPAISLDKSHVNFKELLIGHKATQTVTMINDEDKAFQFSFDQESLYAPGRVACLAVTPMHGTIQPKSKIPIAIDFCPETEQEVNFNMICRVKKKTTLLIVNVKAEGFSIAALLVCEDSQGNKVNLLPTGVNLINLGEVEVNEKAVRQLYIENTGKFNVDFAWELKQPQKPRGRKDAWAKDKPPVSITPYSGEVQCNVRRRCQLSFCPPFQMELKDCEVLLKIVNGQQYRLALAGTGVNPALQFSFTSFDFGPCFVHRPGLPVPKATLVLENTDSKHLGFECQFKNAPYLEVTAESGILSPGKSSQVEILFYPRDLKKYHERIPFEINGLSTVFVDITGQGTEMKVEVANAMEKKINLGALRVGQTSNRSVKIINNSLASIEFTVTITPSSPALQQSNILSISPVSPIWLKPKEATNVFVHFAPKARIPQFSEEVVLECAGVSQPLFILIGSCHGLEVKLDSDAIPFGSVTIGSSSSRKLIMCNSGDIGTAFCWNVEKFKPDFAISPVKGYIAAGMEVSFDIVFAPSTVNQDVRYDSLRCAIEGGRPLKLTLTGSCISQFPMKEVINFQAHVRNREVKNLMIHNKTNQVWLLKPVIDGEYWTGADTITIDPQTGKNYEIAYRPLTMTVEHKKHTGTIFFALPDGSGLLYNLTGSADAPKPVGNTQKDVPCKIPYTEVLQVSNWLRKAQRFRVTIEILKPEKPDPSITLKGLDYADVPGLSRKDYMLNFFAHKEGTISAKVTFKNDVTGEYQFYYVQFKATSPGVIARIDLTTPVRQSTSYTITVNNPLQIPVNFQTNCIYQDINLPPQLTVPPQSEGLVTFEYLPMKSGEITGRLTLQSPELGLYLYDLNLTASPANPERPVHFITNLGTNQSQSCRFINYARSKVEYACKIDNPEFLVERSMTAASASSGGSEVGVDVTFEPTKIGDSQGTLTVISTVGGEYIFPLFGHCRPPKPQGPYTIKAGVNAAIPFKNVFPQTTSFVFHVDSPSFTVKAGETIRGKKTHNITVGFEGNQGESKAVRMGRLVVSCARSVGINDSLNWTFYLKGITP